MKINKNVLSDRALMVISIVIAIGLWLYVVQIQSPDIERTVKDVPIVFSQKTSLENRGLILIDDHEHTMDVRIKGRRQYVYGVTPANLTVVADVSGIETTGSHSLMTNIVLPYANLEIINKSPSILNVTVDDLMEKVIPVTVEPVGNPKDNYVCGETTSSVDKVKIKGPESIVTGIEKISAKLDVSGKSTDVASIAELEVYGSNNKIIKSPYISLSEASLEVRCEILKTKTVDIVPVFAGNISNALNYLPDSNNIKTVKIAGAPEVIDKINEISTKPIYESHIGENGTANVKLNLPTGVRSLDGDSFTFRFSAKEQKSE